MWEERSLSLSPRKRSTIKVYYIAVFQGLLFWWGHLSLHNERKAFLVSEGGRIPQTLKYCDQPLGCYWQRSLTQHTCFEVQGYVNEVMHAFWSGSCGRGWVSWLWGGQRWKASRAGIQPGKDGRVEQERLWKGAARKHCGLALGNSWPKWHIWWDYRNHNKQLSNRCQ